MFAFVRLRAIQSSFAPANPPLQCTDPLPVVRTSNESLGVRITIFHNVQLRGPHTREWRVIPIRTVAQR